MDQKKTLHVCTLCYQPYSHTTGVERYVLGITQGLREIGVDAEIISAEQPRGPGHKVNFPKTQVWILDNLIFSLFSLSKILNPKYDVIHVHGYLAGVFPAILKKLGLLRKPLAYTSHGLVYSHLIEGNLWLFNQTHQLEKLILRNADTVFNGNTSDIGKIMQYARVDERKIKYLYTGGVGAIFKPTDKKEARRILGLPLDRKIVLFVGTFEYRKGLDLLIDAISDLPDTHLYLIGRSTPFSEKVLGDARSQNIHQCGHVPTNIPEKLLPVWYSAADVFVLPSRYESYGLVLLEAMACGTPTISSKIPQIREAFGNATYPVGLDTGELRKGISSVLKDSSLRKSLVTRGFELAKAQSWENKARKLVNIYTENQ